MNHLHDGDRFAGNDNNRRVVHARLAAAAGADFDHDAAWAELDGKPHTCPKKKVAAPALDEPAGSEEVSTAKPDADAKAAAKAAKAAAKAAKLAPPKPAAPPAWSGNA